MNPFDIEKLEQVGKREGMNLGNTEKDYVLSVVLSELSKLGISRQLVFKGGTALKKAYFPAYRFSSDLDFTAIKLDKKQVKKEIEAMFSGKIYAGIQFTEVEDKSEERGGNLNLSLKYESRISVRDGKEHRDSIKLDINFDNTVALSAVERQLVFPIEYGVNATFRAMALEEIVAEKVHAIYSRAKPRDLYDLWFLLTNGISSNKELINEKLKRLETAEEGAPKFEVDYFRERTTNLKPMWEQDIGSLTKNYPIFDDAELDVLKNVNGPNVKESLLRIWLGQIKKSLKEEDTPKLRVVFEEVAQEAQSSKLLQHQELRDVIQNLIHNAEFNDVRTIEALLAVYVNQFYFFRNIVSESAKQMIEPLTYFLAKKEYPPEIKISACKLLLAAGTPEALENFVVYIRTVEDKEEWVTVENRLRDFTTASKETRERLYEKLLGIAGGDSDLGKRIKTMLYSLRTSLNREPPFSYQKKLKEATAGKQPRKKKIDWHVA